MYKFLSIFVASKKFKHTIMDYSISIQKNSNGWLTGQCEQIPEAITEGKDMDHLMKNMHEAIAEALEMRKEEFLFNQKDMDCIHAALYIPNEKKHTAEAFERKRVYA